MNFHREPSIYVNHVHLIVQDLQRSMKFYKDILGFQVLNQTKTTADFTTDGKNILVSVEQPTEVLPKSSRTTGLYHFAILLPERAHLAAIVRYFVEIGFRFASSDHLVSEALYFNDPDGNGIEIYVDRDPSKWDWHNEQVEMAVDPLDFENLLATTPSLPWRGMPSGTVMGHIHLHVSELPGTETFYTKGLGFEVVNRFGPQALFISTGKYHHHIGLNTWNGVGAPPPLANSVGLAYYTIIYPSKEIFETAVDHLRQLGSLVEEQHDYYVTVDPSGNHIHLKLASF